MPQGGAVFGAAVVDGKIYAFGGYEYNRVMYSTAGEYNPVNDTWTIKTPMHRARINFATAVYENKIYIIGGQLYPYWPAIDTVEVYDPATDTWAFGMPLSEPRAMMQANVVNDKIYVIGGSTVPTPNTELDEGMTDTTQVFDPHSNSWSMTTASLNATFSYGSAVFDGKIYVFGGLGKFVTPSGPFGGHRVDVLATNITQIYDPAIDNWSYGVSIPKQGGGEAAGVTSGEMAPRGIYLFSPNVAFTQVYNPTTNSWINGTNTPVIEFTSKIAVINDTMYVMGGQYSARIPSLAGSIEENPSPPFPSSNYQYIPFGYGSFIPLPTPTPSPKPTGLGASSLASVGIAVAVVCVLVAGLVFKRKRRKT